MSFLNNIQLLMNKVEIPPLLLDEYPSTMPFFSLEKCLLSSFVGSDAIVCVKDDGSMTPDEETFGFGTDLSLPLDDIVAFGDGNTVLLKEVMMHNVVKKFEQTSSLSAMPIIAEDNGSGVEINRDQLGRVAAKLTLGRYMEMPLSLSTFNKVHNGTVCSQIFQFERASGTTRSYVFANRPNAGVRGFFIGAGTFFSVPNRLSYRIESPAGQAWYSLDTALADDVGHTVFSTVDVKNATPAERIVNDIDGTVYKTNTQTGTVTPSPGDASFNLTLGSIVSGFEFIGSISAGGWWHNDQRSNKTEILTYI